MITENTIYWITRLDGIKDAITAFGVIFAIVFAILIIIAGTERFDAENKKATKYFILSIVGTLLFTLLAFIRPFIPTTKEMCAIKVVPMIVNNEDTQELPNKVLKLAHRYLDDLLDDYLWIPLKQNRNHKRGQ